MEVEQRNLQKVNLLASRFEKTYLIQIALENFHPVCECYNYSHYQYVYHKLFDVVLGTRTRTRAIVKDFGISTTSVLRVL